MSSADTEPSIECLWQAEAILGEAPLWCVDEQVLYWVDIDGKTVLRFNPETGAQNTFPQPYEIGCIIKRKGGGFIASVEVGIALLDDDLHNMEIIATPEKVLPNNRFNDGKCDHQGRFWTGSLDRGEELPNGSLFRINACDDIKAVLNNLIVPNGMGWSPDSRVMYLTESSLGVIYAYDFDARSGAFTNQRVFVTVDPSQGMPDGLCVDAEGFVWSAHWDGARVTRYNPDGTTDRVIQIPVPLVTSLAFGGKNLDQLYVTTARLTLDEDQLSQYPLSGSLFVVDTGVTGLPEVAFQD